MNLLENRNLVNQLEGRIRASIVIPPQLLNNVFISTTSLGGVFVNYRSNTSGALAMQNSKVQVTFMFHTTDGKGEYWGEFAELEVTRMWGLDQLKVHGAKPPRGIKQSKPYMKSVERLNKWLLDNVQYLYLAIENK